VTVTPSDVQTFLGVASIDSTRAQLLIDKATLLCLDVVSPLTASCDAVILDMVVSAYANPTGTPGQAVGPYSMSGSTGGLYLTKAQLKALRRAAGIGGAFSIGTLPTGTAEVQTVTITGSPAGGTFTLQVPWGTTTAIAYNATNSVVQAALSAIPNLSGTVVTGPVSGTYTVTLPVTVGPATGQIVAVSSLTGGTQPTVLTAITVPGVYAPGAGLDAWDYGNTGTCW
jgi:hypothetical protein